MAGEQPVFFGLTLLYSIAAGHFLGGCMVFTHSPSNGKDPR